MERVLYTRRQVLKSIGIISCIDGYYKLLGSNGISGHINNVMKDKTEINTPVMHVVDSLQYSESKNYIDQEVGFFQFVSSAAALFLIEFEKDTE